MPRATVQGSSLGVDHPDFDASDPDATVPPIVGPDEVVEYEDADGNVVTEDASGDSVEVVEDDDAKPAKATPKSARK